MSDYAPPVSVLVSSKDRRSLLREAVASLRRLDYPARKLEIVVIEETDEPEDPGADRYVSLPREGRGFAWSRNAAVRTATHALVAFTDDDCLVDPRWLRELVAPFEDPEIAAVAGGVLAQPCGILGKTEIVLGFPGGGLRRIARCGGERFSPTRELSTVNAAVRRERILALGGFSEKTGIYGGEDSHFFSRLTERHRAVFNPRALVFHRARDSARGIARWFYRRGIAEITLTRLTAPSRWARFRHHLRTSVLVRIACFAAALALAPIATRAPLLVLVLGLLYYALLLARYRFALAPMGWPVLLLTPFTKLLMDVSFDVGRLRGLVLRESRAEKASTLPAPAPRRATSWQRPVRVLLVENSASLRGGGQVSFLDLMGRIDRKRYEPIAAAPDEGDFLDAVRAQGIPAFVLPMPSLRGLGFLSLPRSLWIWKRFLHRHAIDLIHANGTRAMIYAGLAGRFSRRPVLWHVRVLGQKSDARLDRFLARLSSRVLVNSAAVAERFSFLDRSPKERGPDVVPNGVDVEAFAHAVPDEAFAREAGLAGKNVLVLVAQLIPWKRHALAIEMISELKRGGREASLVLLGDEVPESRGYRARLVDEAARWGVAGNCIFAGFRPRVAGILKLADLLVHPATPEPFGRALIEAMAAGIPVVAAAGGGVSEVVEDGVTGILLTSSEPACWARTVEELLKDEPRRHRMGRAARRRAEILFSSRLHARRVQGLYDEVLEGGR